MKRVILILVLVAVGVGVYFWWRPRVETLVLTGIVDGNQVAVGSKITGRVDQLDVQDGQSVEAGQLIAVLDQAELSADNQAADDAIAQADANAAQAQAQAGLLESTLPAKVAQARAQLAQAEAQLSQQQANVKAAQAAWDKAHSNFVRVQPLVQKGADSPQDLDNAQADLDSAAAGRTAAAAAEEAANRAVVAAQANLNDATEQLKQVGVQEDQARALQAAARQAVASRAAAVARLGQTQVVAPVSGIVTLRVVRQGEVVTAGSPLVTIYDLGDTWVDADVEETYAPMIKLGQELQVKLTSGQVLTGPVIYKATEADFATQRDVSHTKRDIKTVEIRVRVPNPQGQLALGMTAWVMLPLPAPGTPAIAPEPQAGVNRGQ